MSRPGPGYAKRVSPESWMRALFWLYLVLILGGLAAAFVIGALGR